MTETFPVMRGNAAMAVGASYFEVPLFSHIIDNLWQGCSPAVFPDLVEQEGGYFYANYSGDPVQCKWLWNSSYDPNTGANGPKVGRFDKILNLYRWEDYEVPPTTERHTVEMFDGEHIDADQVDNLAHLVTTWLKNGNVVLVHCQAGLNRSSLIVARVLMLHYQKTADEAIDLIREKRSPQCLCNDHFRQWLKGLK